MKKHHTTIVLAIVFFTGLIVLWWADYTGVDRDVSNAVLPALDKVAIPDIKRIEVEGPADGREPSDAKTGKQPGTGRIVVERHDDGRWQLLEPFEAAADPSLVETLVRNLKDMRKSPNAGTIHDPPATFGLDPPATTVRVYGNDPTKQLAALDVGRSVRDQLYVRPEGTSGIEVVDPRLLAMLTLAPAKWRDKALFHLPSFGVGALSVEGPGRALTVERDEGHWQLVRPFRAPAEDEKVEGIVAELTSLRVAEGDAGFVADDVKGEDAAKYGLDRPAMTIELRPAAGPGKPQTLVLGKPDPEKPELYYARAGDQDDVVLVGAKNFQDLGLDLKELRSKKVAELNPARVEFLRIEAFGRTFDLSRTTSGWQQLRPVREPAEGASVARLLNGLGEAQTSDFLDPASVPRAGIDPPSMTISVWQAAPRAKPAVGLDTPPQAAPRVVLQVGQSDAFRKIVYARLAGDPSLLAIPDTFSEALPRSPLAFRTRTVLALSPAQIHRLTIEREGSTYELAAPTQAGGSTHWRMIAPVAARADDEAATRAVMLLASLRAEEYVADEIGDGKAYGLASPRLTVTWTTPVEANAGKGKVEETRKERETRIGTLRIGAKLLKSDRSYANIKGTPAVFTLSDKSIEVFEAEFHTHRVLAFSPGHVRRIVLRWPGRTLAFRPQEAPGGKGFRWVPEPGTDPAGFDFSRVGPLVENLANLNTSKFLQYTGPISASSGLNAPRLTIEVELGDGGETRVLRIGRTSDEQAYATTAAAAEASGPLFLLTGAAWSDLVRHVPGGTTLPADVFAPETATGKPSR